MLTNTIQLAACGHPQACRVPDPDELPFEECRWCLEVAGLRKSVVWWEDRQLQAEFTVKVPFTADNLRRMVEEAGCPGAHFKDYSDTSAYAYLTAEHDTRRLLAFIVDAGWKVIQYHQISPESGSTWKVGVGVGIGGGVGVPGGAVTREALERGLASMREHEESARVWYDRGEGVRETAERLQIDLAWTQRALALERGDASAAPAGWFREFPSITGRFCWVSKEWTLERAPEGDGPTSWAARRRDKPGIVLVRELALKAMEDLKP